MVLPATKTNENISPFRVGTKALSQCFCGVRPLFTTPLELHVKISLSESPLCFSFASHPKGRKNNEDFLWIKTFTSQSSFRIEVKLGCKGFCAPSTPACRSLQK